MILVVSARNPDSTNIKITKEELDRIRQLGDFDLTMFLSELHDFGWDGAKRLLPDIWKAHLKERGTDDKQAENG